MVKKLTWLMLLVLGCIAPIALAGIEATATVDRQSIEQQDTLTLKVRINDTGRYETPDLSGLKQNFEVLSTSQNSRHSIINGNSNSMTEWTITLYPKRTGQLIIPAIKIDGAKTRPIKITVKQNAPAAAGELQPVFMESTISQTEAYVQQQLIYTLRIFHSIQLDNLNVTEPEFDSATLKKLSQNSFRRNLNGTPYRVHEITYGIYPQEPGELIIPEQVFTATQATGRSSMFQRFDRGPVVRRMSEQHSINVKAAPNLKGSALWLPAKKLTLVETWSSSPRELREGDSVTRTITIKAEGVMASQLPPTVFSKLDGAKLYPDKGQTNNEEKADGLLATRTDSTAIIPTRAGKLTLPVIEVQWWDTQANKLRTASIPSKTLNILPALEGDTQQASRAFDHSSNPLNQTAPKQEIIYQSNPFWMLLSALLAIVWVCTLLAYWHLRRSTQHAPTLESEITTTSLSEKAAFKALSEACRSQDMQRTRQAMIDWGNSYWPEQGIASLNDIQRQVGEGPIHTCLQQLDNALFGNRQDHSWNGEGLLSAIQLFKKSQTVKKQQSAALSPLYESHT